MLYLERQEDCPIDHKHTQLGYLIHMSFVPMLRLHSLVCRVNPSYHCSQ